MALQVWLPLNGNLTNQGLNDINASGSLVYSDAGKIGKCANVDSGHILTIPYSSGAAYDFSFSFWIKIPTAMSSNTEWESMLSFGAINTANSTTINTISMNFAPYQQVKIYDDANHQHIWRTPIYDVWEHWSIVHHSTTSSSNIKFYINGILNGSYDTAHPLILQNGNIHVGYSVSVGSFALNDFRIYDHCLSPKEVKEISKGLCLHYKLDGVCNTIDNTEWDCSGFENHGTKNGSITSIDSGGRYSKAYSFNGSLNNYISATVDNLASVINSQQLTISYWCYDTNSGGGSNACPVCIGSAAEQNKFLLLHANAAYGIGLCFYSNDLWNTSTKLTPNTWNLLTFVIDNGTRSIYLNGNKISSAAYSSNLSVDTPLILGIGKDPIRNDYQLSGSISDLRIYATALSDSDILELYESGGAIDSNYNSYVYEYVTDDSNEYLNSQGVSGISDLEETDGRARWLSTGKIESNNFYEI